MFPVDLDHLNILIMLILAFFSFRAYNSDTLAIQYEPQQQQVEGEKKQSDQQVEGTTEQVSQLSEMISEQVDNTLNAQVAVLDDVVQVDQVQIDVENIGSQNLQSELTAQQNKLIEVTETIQCSNSYLTGLLNQGQAVEKDEEQESTLVNRVQSGFSQEACDQQLNVECSSSSDDSSVSSQGIFPDLDCSEAKEVSHKQKRKQIKKAKRELKQNLRRQQQVRLQGQIEAV